MPQQPELDQLCINTIRFLAVDAVQKARSGHPGTPMGAAAIAYTLWDRFLKHNPTNPTWPDRDRFILSAGHASMLLYALLHLTGYDLPLDELERFRTHDSIGLGEDGPTHQPIEHLMSLRAVPNLTVIRPADATETAEAWRAALLNADGPTTLVFTRQKLPVLDRTELASAEGLQRGGYVLWQSDDGTSDVIMIGTGSEVHIALEAGKQLAAEGVSVRVVSLPSWELFDHQSADYRESVLPSTVRARVAVEAGIELGWEHYVGLDGAVVRMRGFGASAPSKVLYEQFGITVENVVAQARRLLKER